LGKRQKVCANTPPLDRRARFGHVGTALGKRQKVCANTPPLTAEPGSATWGPRWGKRQNNQPGRRKKGGVTGVR
jgi:hypothetical protein